MGGREKGRAGGGGAGWGGGGVAAGSFVGSHDLGYYVEDIDGGEEAPLPPPCLRRPRGL